MRISDWSSDVCSSDLDADDLRIALWAFPLSQGCSDRLLGRAAGADRRCRGAAGARSATLDLGGDRVHRAVGCRGTRSEEHTSELQSLMRISYAVFCLKKKKITNKNTAK